MKLTLEFTLALRFSDFDGEPLKRFLRAVSTLSGAPLDQIDVLEIREGCVTIIIVLDDEAARKLIAAIDPGLDDIQPMARDQEEALAIIRDELQLQFVPRIVARGTDVRTLPASVQRNTIFLIHGWRGGEESFGKLPSYLEEATGCQCKVFIYPTGTWDYSAPLSFAARALDNWIRNELSESRGNCAIIAHSMGGILTRDFLASQLASQRPLDHVVRQVTFVASPLSGVWLAKLGRLIPLLSSARQIAEIASDSQYLGRVTSMWNAWLPKQSHLVGNVRSIFSAEDEIVDFVSAIGTDPEAIPILRTSHSSIVQPQSAADDIVRTLTRVVREAGLTNL